MATTSMLVSSAVATVKAFYSKIKSLLETKDSALELSRDIKSVRTELELTNHQFFNPKRPEIQTRHRIRELKEVAYDMEIAYDMEDYIEKLMIAGDGSFFSNVVKTCGSRQRVDRKIQELKRRVEQVKGNLPVSPVPASASASNLRSDNKIVGMDDKQINELAELLKKDESADSSARLMVVSIVGIEGLGKTTLARQVYCKIGQEFDCKAWLMLSKKPDNRRVLMDLLRRVQIPDTAEEEKNLGERDLIKKIRGSLQNQRYLLVIDDVWSLEEWEIIKLALPMNSLHSRIITTTRVQRVAKSCCSHWNDVVYEIRPLSMHDSRKLFYTRIFESGSCPPDLVEISDKILLRCYGSPLAINYISSLLATKGYTKEQWSEVANFLSASSVGSTTTIKHILSLSYYYLPSHLKGCLLYLVLRWIAEGFIAEESGRNLKELGESYFNELIDRSMIQPVHVGYDGQPEDCQVHTLMHDFIVSLSTEENFVLSLGDQKPECISHKKIRRLSLNNTNEDHHIPAGLVAQSKSRMRSLAIVGSLGSIPSLQSFVLLRVLDLEDCHNLENRHLKEIGNLQYLRYLNIRNSPISKIPDQIMKLKLLQTLDLRGTEVLELQANVVHLVELAYLYCSLSRIPKWFTSLPNLAYACIDVGEVKNKDLQLLSCLPSLIHLSLSSTVVPIEELVIGNEGFSTLREFHLHSAWANLKFKPGSMPKIENLLLLFHVLTVENRGFSVSIESLECLKKFDVILNIEGCNELQFNNLVKVL
uniref:Uncharacterized protein n=1 Tax=Leersia perrieri TaxID=77586 RepID=A0A0D9XU68_9ORYZ